MKPLLRILFLALALVAVSEHDVLANAFDPAPPPLAHRVVAQGSAPLWGRARAVAFSHVQSAPLAPPRILPTHIVTLTALVLHAQPCADSPALASLPTGRHVPVRAVLAGGEWLQLTWQGQHGWVAASQVEVVP